MSKDIYNYEPYAHTFIGKAKADPDPLVKGGWILPANSTVIAPPVTADRQAAVFDAAAQAWSVVPDWRQIALYETATGAPYNPFTNSAGVAWIPVGPLPDWLTDQAQPSPDHVWSNGGWVLDVVRETARLTVDAQMKTAQMLAAAELQTQGLTDAYVSGQLSDEEKARFEAWAAYKRALFLVPSQPGYPRSIEWPASPTA
ncbi:tail fiber assembly protein [Paraburkholderia madseniana]|uniref:tail fiber assembly protein n=1 Tax=Paraburkholderia madseniana TaxID=2599607 RepID=UPI0015C56B3B|nr:tail fiber assembly protein [Paraburkholderia madseniana]NPT63593.1 hypothetical protein [Paraburkholderia madseniana]